MNFGPLEFADYLRRRGEDRSDLPTVRAARAAAPAPSSVKHFDVLSGPRAWPPRLYQKRLDPACVFEAVATCPTNESFVPDVVRVMVKAMRRPAVLVLSSHQGVEWQVELDPGTRVVAVMLGGFGYSTVAGVEPALVHRIGGFYAFKPGSVEYRHLESEVRRCTGRDIAGFQQSVYTGEAFEVG